MTAQASCWGAATWASLEAPGMQQGLGAPAQQSMF